MNEKTSGFGGPMFFIDGALFRIFISPFLQSKSKWACKFVTYYFIMKEQ